MSDHTAGSLVIIDVSPGKAVRRVARASLPQGWQPAGGRREVPLRGRPAGVAWSADGRLVYVAEHTAGTIAEVDREGKVRRRLKAGPWPVGLALAPRRGLLLAADSATGAMVAVNLADGTERARVAAVRAPYFLAVTPDEALAVVGNRLPAGDERKPPAGWQPAGGSRRSASVTLIDLATMAKVADVRLPPNSINVHGVAISAHGRWAYVAHGLARAVLPTEQIEYGWINANALSILDLSRRSLHATVLLDRREEGAANPWGVAVEPGGAALWITLSGVHQLARVDLRKLHEALEGHAPRLARWRAALRDGKGDPDGVRGEPVFSDSAPAFGDDPASVELVVSDVPAAYGQGVYLGGVCSRIDLPGNGPRGLAIAPDGRRLAAALYYSGGVALVDARTAEVSGHVALAGQPEADDARRGEMIFHDARRCYQHWHSCATCHPDGRADGLNWDLLNDGIGSPKNTRSLVLAHRTPPAMWRGVRASMDAAAAAGFRFILFQPPRPGDVSAVLAYLRSLGPEPSPFLVNGRLSEKAKRGEALFDDAKAACAACHPRPLFTDLKLHNVGTHAEPDRAEAFDTPSLVEIWRTAPYLHHGRARTLREVLRRFNRDDRHGTTSHLSDEELDALVEYLKSL